MQSIKRGDFYLWRIVVNRESTRSLSLSLSRSCNKYKSESNRRNAMLGCNLLKEKRLPKSVVIFICCQDEWKHGSLSLSFTCNLNLNQTVAMLGCN